MQTKQKKEPNPDTDIKNQEIAAKVELKRVQDITALFGTTERYESPEINKIITKAITDPSYTKEMVNKQILDQIGKESPDPIGSHRTVMDNDKSVTTNFFD